MRIPYWQIEPVWRGETVAILGGGPSLTRAQVEHVRGKCRVIAVNTSFVLAPWADVVFFYDHEWFGWWRATKVFRGFSGIKAALQNAQTYPSEPHIRVLQNYGGPPERVGLCPHNDGIYTGRNAGNGAMQVAAHLGAKRILLLGFDMKAQGARTHWHSGDEKLAHRRPTAPKDIEAQMLPWFPHLKADLDAKGIEVVNCSPGSALACFPMAPLEVALAADPDLEACLAPTS